MKLHRRPSPLRSREANLPSSRNDASRNQGRAHSTKAPCRPYVAVSFAVFRVSKVIRYSDVFSIIIKSHLVESVQEARHKILDDVVAAVAGTKRKFTLGLGKTILRYKAISDRLEGQRGGLLLSVTQPSTSRCNYHQKENEQDCLLLSDFLKGHHDIANHEQIALQTHLDDWANIQSDIVELAVEVLGPDHVSSPRYDPAECESQLAASASDRPVIRAWCQRTGTKIEGLARETQKQLAAQEKVNGCIL